MPVLSCGGMRYQQNWKDIPLDEVEEANQANLEATIRKAVDSGINHIETARGYGSSERQLGLVLPKFPRDQIIVQTKVGPEDDPKVFRQNFDESLERLQLDYVDLLAIHGVNDEGTLEQATRPNGCLSVCRQIQKEGLARHIGFSTHAPLDVLLEAIKTERDGGFDYVNLHWYYIFQTNWPAVLEARKRDMGIFIISPSDKGGMLYKPSDKLAELTKPLHPIVFNDLFCLDREEVHTLSVGAARPTDFDLHLEAVALYERRGEYLPAILEKLDTELKNVVGEDYARHYADGVPKWQEVPGGVNIQKILWLMNLVKAYDMTEYAKMRYNLLGNAGHWFPGENAGKLADHDVSPALKNARFREEIPALLRQAHELLYTAPVKRLSESD